MTLLASLAGPWAPAALAADRGAGDIAQIIVFLVIALLSLLAKRKGRTPPAEDDEEEAPDGGEEGARRRRPQPARPEPLARAPEPEAAPRTLVQLEHAPSVRLPSSQTRGGHLQPGAAGAASAAPRTGRDLLLAPTLAPAERVRAGLLWREVLGPPVCLDDPLAR